MYSQEVFVKIGDLIKFKGSRSGIPREEAHLRSDLDGPIRANRFADSCILPDSRESFQGSRTGPFFLRIELLGAKNSELHVSHESLEHYERGFFCESIRANRFVGIVANRRAI